MHGNVQLSLSLLMYVMPIALHVMLVPLVLILIACSFPKAYCTVSLYCCWILSALKYLHYGMFNWLRTIAIQQTEVKLRSQD